MAQPLLSSPTRRDTPTGFMLALTDRVIYSMAQAYAKQQDRLLLDSGAEVHICPLDYAP